MGNDPERQMVRVAFMDTAEDLSIQVHPDGAMAEVEGDFEKSESWYILEAAEGAYVTARHPGDGQGADQEGDPRGPAGGASGPVSGENRRLCDDSGRDGSRLWKGLLALEVGSFGGTTYRLYDYGRGRGLNLEEGLLALKPQLKAGIDHPEPEAYQPPGESGAASTVSGGFGGRAGKLDIRGI